MKFKCINVTYGQSMGMGVTIDPNAPPPPGVSTTATVLFAPVIDEPSALTPSGQFTLTFTNVTEALDYFPGRIYELELNLVVED